MSGGVSGKTYFSIFLNFGTCFWTDFDAVSSNMVLIFKINVQISRSQIFDSVVSPDTSPMTAFFPCTGITVEGGSRINSHFIIKYDGGDMTTRFPARIRSEIFVDFHVFRFLSVGGVSGGVSGKNLFPYF